MNRNAAREMLDAGAENVDRTGFFCFMSKKKNGLRRAKARSPFGSISAWACRASGRANLSPQKHPGGGGRNDG
jgi:hypothetical protein